jgi:hypothetical protein
METERARRCFFIVTLHVPERVSRLKSTDDAAQQRSFPDRSGFARFSFSHIHVLLIAMNDSRQLRSLFPGPASISFASRSLASSNI